VDTFTLLHVVVSLIGIASGLVVLSGLIASRLFDGWNAVFLVSTTATSLTGFFFPFHGFTPGLAVGVISTIVLAIAVIARYVRRLAGAWRRTYVISATVALYFNVFVLVVQLFEKVPSLRELAPTQSEAPFVAAQIAVLALFLVLGTLAVRRFRAASLQAARSASAS